MFKIKIVESVQILNAKKSNADIINAKFQLQTATKACYQINQLIINSNNYSITQMIQFNKLYDKIKKKKSIKPIIQTLKLK